jgi:hypothetical protein
MAGYFVIWNEMCQSVGSGEEGEGWPSYEAALTACVDGADMPAFHAEGRGLVFGRTACAKAEAAAMRADAQDRADSARRAAVVASFTSPIAAPIAPSADERRANMLTACRSALAVEQTKRRPDQSELARLAGNIERLTAQEVVHG